MKIITICRTRNEARNIERFCEAYHWTDAVLIGDGGSDDNTVALAGKYPNVKCRTFNERVYKNQVWRNPHGKHINFMIDWALAERADWIIFDDCDCVPTRDLQRLGAGILEQTEQPVVMLYRLYIYGDRQYFPEMNKPGQSLYAWRYADMPIRAEHDSDWGHRLPRIWSDEDELRLDHPLCCLHYTWPDEETVARKRAWYTLIKDRPMPHPTHSFGRLEDLPEWAR